MGKVPSNLLKPHLRSIHTSVCVCVCVCVCVRVVSGVLHIFIYIYIYVYCKLCYSSCELPV
jgi:hypothetical protein